jgi:hypothetical protein
VRLLVKKDTVLVKWIALKKHVMLGHCIGHGSGGG